MVLDEAPAKDDHTRVQTAHGQQVHASQVAQDIDYLHSGIVILRRLETLSSRPKKIRFSSVSDQFHFDTALDSRISFVEKTEPNPT